MKVGDVFERYGSFWKATAVTQEQNKVFTWLKVIAEWAHQGPMPLWHKEPRVFYIDRHERTDT